MNTNHDSSSRSSDSKSNKNQGGKPGISHQLHESTFSQIHPSVLAIAEIKSIREDIKITEELWKIAVNEGRTEDKRKLQADLDQLGKSLEKIWKAHPELRPNDSSKGKATSEATNAARAKSSVQSDTPLSRINQDLEKLKKVYPATHQGASAAKGGNSVPLTPETRSKSLSELVKDLEGKCELAFQEKRFEELLELRKQLAQLQKELNPASEGSAQAARNQAAAVESISIKKTINSLDKEFEKAFSEGLTEEAYALLTEYISAKQKLTSSIVARQVPTQEEFKTDRPEVFAIKRLLNAGEISLKYDYTFGAQSDKLYFKFSDSSGNELPVGTVLAKGCLTYDGKVHVVKWGFFGGNYSVALYKDATRTERLSGANFKVTGKTRHFEIAIDGRNNQISVAAFAIPKQLKIAETIDEPEPFVRARQLIDEKMKATESELKVIYGQFVRSEAFSTFVDRRTAWLNQALVDYSAAAKKPSESSCETIWPNIHAVNTPLGPREVSMKLNFFAQYYDGRDTFVAKILDADFSDRIKTRIVVGHEKHTYDKKRHLVYQDCQDGRFKLAFYREANLRTPVFSVPFRVSGRTRHFEVDIFPRNQRLSIKGYRLPNLDLSQLGDARHQGFNRDVVEKSPERAAGTWWRTTGGFIRSTWNIFTSLFESSGNSYSDYDRPSYRSPSAEEPRPTPRSVGITDRFGNEVGSSEFYRQRQRENGE